MTVGFGLTRDEFVAFAVNCTGTFSDDYYCTLIDASMLVYTDGVNETYDDLLLPIMKEYMDSGRFNDLHPAIVNVTFVNETQLNDESTTTESSSGIQNPGLFGILGIFVVAVIAGFFISKRRKDHQAVDTGDVAEDSPQSTGTIAKGVQQFPPKEHAPDQPVIQNVSVHDSVAQDTTFDVYDSEEEFEC